MARIQKTPDGKRPTCACCGKRYGSRHRNWPVKQAYADPWDGSTIFTMYEPFCTLRCALVYARAMYNKYGSRAVLRKMQGAS